MLAKVKLALRITTTDFDAEIQSLINDCVSELEMLGVIVDDTDPQIVTAVIAYAKWQFGDAEDADKWRSVYDRKLAQFKMATGYTDWGE